MCVARFAFGLPHPVAVLAMVVVTALLSASPARGQTWTQVWSDEFDSPAGTAIDASKWQFDRGNLGVNNELEFYCAPSDPSPCDAANPNAFIDGSGHLILQAIRLNSGTSAGSNSWTSARLNTGNNLASFQYGRIESRMQLPVGAGLWPAFWALGNNINTVGWPACGEMDFMENVPASAGLGPNVVSSTIHGPGYFGGNGLGKKYTLPNGSDITSFHIYGAIWSPYMVQFYVDDPSNVFFIRTANDIPTGSSWAFNHPFFALANLAVGGTGSWPGPPDSTTPSPAQMVVDYVRAYQPAKIPVADMGTPSPLTVKAGASGSTTLHLTAPTGSGRAYLSCSVDAPKSTCEISSGNALNASVVDFSSSPSATATLSVHTTANMTTADLFPRTSSRLGLALAMTAMLTLGAVWMAPGRARASALGMTLLTLLLAAACIAQGCGAGSGGGGGGGSGGNGTPPGSYHAKVSVYNLSSDLSDTASYGTVSISLTVN